MFLRKEAATIEAHSRVVRTSSRRKEEGRPLWEPGEMERTRKVSNQKIQVPGPAWTTG